MVPLYPRITDSSTGTATASYTDCCDESGPWTPSNVQLRGRASGRLSVRVLSSPKSQTDRMPSAGGRSRQCTCTRSDPIVCGEGAATAVRRRWTRWPDSYFGIHTFRAGTPRS
eukprot:scaffold24432_cov101-Isochrysis_galbana.AAC.2